MKLLITKSTAKHEKGIALIFSLIMLSLLLIMALSFALDSMYDQKAAYNSANVSSAGLLAKSQLNQVLLLMKNGQANFATLTNSSSTISASRLYSVDSSTPQVTHSDMLTDIMPVAGTLEYDASSPGDNDPVLDAVRVNWNYIREPSTGQILGRTAFVVVPEDKIPFDSLVSKTLAEQSFGETRIGKEVSEINVYATGVTGSRGLSDIVKIITPLNWTDQSGQYTGIWTSFNQMFGYINALLATDLTETEKDVFEQRLSISVNKTKEMFWADLDGQTDKDTGEFYKRFNLTRTDWSSSTDNAGDIDFIREKILYITNNSSTNPSFAIDKDMEKWDENVSDSNSYGLPWLACFGYKTDGTEDSSIAGTFTNVKDRRYQIAANLKDYCDSDSYPTSDVDPRGASATNWKNSVAHPTYTGNERTPYIDKLGVYITATTVKEYDTATAGTSDGWLYSTIEIVPCAGLINMYGTSWPTSLVVYVDMNVSFTATVNTTPVTIPDQNVTLTINIGSGIWFSGYTNFAWASGSTSFDTAKTAVDPVDSAKMTLKVANIKINRAVLYDTSGNSDCYDYVKGLDKSIDDSTEITLFNAVLGGNSIDYLMGWAAHDPRQNLNGSTKATDGSQDWKLLTGQNVDVYAPDQVFSYLLSFPVYRGKPNCLNSSNGIGDDTDKPSDGDGTNTDMETGVTDSANYGISTARIKNAPMDSPWELGFIHRGKKWQTINLKAYDTSKAYQVTKIPAATGKNYILGGGLYSSGDANILDQIKMSPDAETLQKIALDTKNNDPSFTIMALISRIYYGCGVDAAVSISSMATGSSPAGTELTYNSTDAVSLCTAIKTYYDNSTNPEYRLTRASVASQLLLSTSSTPALTSPTDAQQEELIGKVINLTEIAGIGGNFTIIVLAQTIKDIGAASPDVISVTKTSADGSATQPVPCQLGRFDVVGPTGTSTLDSDWKRNIYGDEITGEQKIMVKGNISNGVVTIESFQYIE